MTYGDGYEKGCDFWLVMFMDRRYCFGDVKEFNYFSDVKELCRWQLVMSMNRGMFIDWWCSWIQNIVLVMLMNWPFLGDRWVAITLFGDVNESDYSFGSVNEIISFSDVNKLGEWHLVMSMKRGVIFDWWYSWIGGIVLVMIKNLTISVM